MVKDSKQRGREFRERQKAKALPSSSEIRSAQVISLKTLVRANRDDLPIEPLLANQIQFLFNTAVDALKEKGFSHRTAAAEIFKAWKADQYPHLAYAIGVATPNLQLYEAAVYRALLTLMEKSETPFALREAEAKACIERNRDKVYEEYEQDGSPDDTADVLFTLIFNDLEED